MGSHDCWNESVVNDVTSIVGIGLLGELELRDALLKFRDPGTGGSESGRGENKDEFPWEEMVSVSVEKDEL